MTDIQNIFDQFQAMSDRWNSTAEEGIPQEQLKRIKTAAALAKEKELKQTPQWQVGDLIVQWSQYDRFKTELIALYAKWEPRFKAMAAEVFSGGA